MNTSQLSITHSNSQLFLYFSGELTLYTISKYQKQLDSINFSKMDNVKIDLNNILFLDTTAALFINNLLILLRDKKIQTSLLCQNRDVLDTIELVQNQKKSSSKLPHAEKKSSLESFGKVIYENYLGFLSFIGFLGELFSKNTYYLLSIKHIRYKEIAFEIHESGIRALWIVALTSFLIGLVVAYQSAFQLKLYGANIFIVDMLGISILRELAPLITAIVIAGRSGSAFTAQIGAMKITQELDAMRTMGFDPFMFLIQPRIIALMITLPILIFVSDMMGILGGMVVAYVDLDISPDLFLNRFSNVIAAKHFFIGLIKGPFFAFLIATIGIYRGLMVKDDTQSIGFNTTKSVVESIFAVIICDAIFSITFTNLGI